MDHRLEADPSLDSSKALADTVVGRMLVLVGMHMAGTGERGPHAPGSEREGCHQRPGWDVMDVENAGTVKGLADTSAG